MFFGGTAEGEQMSIESRSEIESVKCRRNRASKYRCHPVFSDEDSDLRELKWRTDAHGYARRTKNSSDVSGRIRAQMQFAHRVVLAREAAAEAARLKRIELGFFGESEGAA